MFSGSSSFLMNSSLGRSTRISVVYFIFVWFCTNVTNSLLAGPTKNLLMRKEPTCKGSCNCYFCGMLMLQKNNLFLLCAAFALLFSSCDSLFGDEEEKEPLARVGDT